jgi:hypothetical protein
MGLRFRDASPEVEQQIDRLYEKVMRGTAA